MVLSGVFIRDFVLYDLLSYPLQTIMLKIVKKSMFWTRKYQKNLLVTNKCLIFAQHKVIIH